MKRLASLLLILILTALCATALATGTDGLGDTVTRSAELAAFLDGNGNIYVSGLDKPVNTTKADSLVSIDAYRILFFAQANPAAGVPQGRLVALKLDGFEETAVTDDAYAACLDQENVYYISRSNRAQLMRYDLDSQVAGAAFTGTESLDRIYKSSAGVITTLVDGAGAYITDSITGQFVPYAGDAATEIAEGDGFEVYKTDAAILYVRVDGSLIPTMVDSNVRDWAIIGHELYYLNMNGETMGLRKYDVANNLWSYVLTPSADMLPQLTASENSLFMLSANNVIYSVDVVNQRLANFATLPTTQSYALTGTRSLIGYRIEAVSGQLNVYGVVHDSSLQPAFTFVDFGAQPTQSEPDGIMLLSAYTIEAESTVWDLLQPAPQYSTLRRGSRGDAVSAIQQPLYDKGYYNYYIDGIFGWRTERAVELLQDALDRPVNGIADEDLQRIILTTNFPAYDPYRTLSRGNRGMRVREMQQRLRDLGYLADNADGIFGPRTQAAVELFQSENRLKVTGKADSETLRILYSASAQVCSRYIDLRKGDTGYRVRELNRRLKELYYLEGSVGSTYTSATVQAVKRFQKEIGMRQTGEATEAMQKELFKRSAPEYSGYITLRRGDNNSRVRDMQRRLKDLGYYTGSVDGYFGKLTYQAVRAFQRQAGLKVTGVADPNTLRRLYANDAPEYHRPVDLTTPVIDLVGIFEMDKDGAYLIPVGSGSLVVYWSAEGVENYDIRLSADGETIMSQNKILDETVGIPMSWLNEGINYTFTVTAHPIDTFNNKDASASLSFRLVSEPAVVESVTISPINQIYTMENGVYLIPGDTIGFRWSAYGDVERYSFTVFADNGGLDPIAQGEAANLTEWSIESDRLTPEYTYTLTVYAYPENGTMDDAATDSVEFRVSEPLTTPEPEVTATPEPEETATPEPEETATPEPEETETPTPDETEATEPAETEPAVPDETEPAESDEIEPTVPDDNGEEVPDDEEIPDAIVSDPQMGVSPAIGSVTMDVTTPDGSVETAEVYEVGDGAFELSWAAEGDIMGYNVRIMDSNGNVMVDQNLTNPGASVNSENLNPNEVYTVTATAYFSNGATTDSALYIMRTVEEQPEEPEYEEPTENEPEYEEPTYEEPAYEEPAYEEPAYEEPAYEEPAYEEPAYEEPAYEEPAYEEPAYEEPAYEEAAYEEPEYDDEPEYEEPEYEEPAYEEPAYDEPEYEEPAYDPYPMDDPSAWRTAIDAYFDSEGIAVLQQRLREWGWLGSGYSEGTLDDATVQAVIDFQNHCNEIGKNVSVTDPSDPVIETDTLRLLFNADGETYKR